jgi:hypothetical protein
MAYFANHPGLRIETKGQPDRLGLRKSKGAGAKLGRPFSISAKHPAYWVLRGVGILAVPANLVATKFFS